MNRSLTFDSTFLIRFSACAAALVGLAGCPQGAELEDPELYGPIGSGGSTAGSGGSGVAGTTPTAGTGGSVACTSEPDAIPGVTCDWVTAVTKSCAISSCHGRLFDYGGLLMTPDSCFVSRVKDVTVTLADVDCDPDPVGYTPCEVPPAECQPFVGTKIIDSANPDNSFMLKKMMPGCGNVMPLAPGDSPDVGWDETRRACIEELVRGIAALP